MMKTEPCRFCNESNVITEVKLSIPICLKCMELAISKYDTNEIKPHPVKKDLSLELKEYTIGFGKFKGKKILDVDANYLKWCLENFNGLRDVEIFKKAYEALSGKSFTSTISALTSQNQNNNSQAPAPATPATPAIAATMPQSAPNELEEDFPF